MSASSSDRPVPNEAGANRHLMYSRFYPAEDDAFHSPVCRRLLAYWRDKAAGRRRPIWTDINLIDLYDIAPWMMVRDLIDGGQEYSCRFCGTGLVQTLGVDPTGKLLKDVYAEEGQEMMRQRYGMVREADGPVRLAGFLRVVEKNLPTGFEGILLPLSDASGALAHIILVLDFAYDPAVEGIPAPTA